MKKLSLNFLMLAGLLFALVAFTFIKESGITGKISPADGASEVLAVSGADTLRTGVNNGSFVFSPVKPGTYTIWVKAKAPYKDTSVEDVAVVDSAVTDIGEIKLEQ